MKFLSRLALPALAAAFLVVAGSDARADMCFGGPRPPVTQPDAGQPPSADGGYSWTSPFAKQLGTGFLAAAALSTGWLCFRRKGKDQE